MKFKHFLMGAAALAIMSLATVGCNENPSEPTPTDSTSAPDPVTNVQATSLSSTSVGLKWNKPAANDSGITGYAVSWKVFKGGDSGSTTVGVTEATINNLLSTQEYYTFTVKSMRGTKASSGVSVQWAPADRYVNDAATTTTTIRMYELSSQKGSGLVLDPSKGGPKNVSVATYPTLGDIQLAMVLTPNGDSVYVGVAYGFPEFQNVDLFDQNVYASDQTNVVSSLDEWYLSKSLDNYINTTPTGNLISFELPTNVVGTSSQGFVVRTGVSGNYHYARVLVKNIGGKFVQGTAPDRYVTLEISYQKTANLPYAKPRAGGDSPVGVHAIYRAH